MEFWFLVMTGQALLISPKGTKRVQGWSRQIMGGRLLLFAILLLCEITTSFRVEHTYKARRLLLQLNKSIKLRKDDHSALRF